MKAATKKKKGSIFTLLLRNYIFFTLVLVIVLCAMFVYLLVRMYNNFQEFDYQQVECSAPLLADGTYDQFPSERLLGEKGFIAVLDESGNTIYNAGNLDISFTNEELLYIPPYRMLGNISVEELPLPDGRINYMVSLIHTDDTDPYTNTAYIFDEDYHLIYASGEYISSDITEKEYQLLSQTYFTDYSVSRYPFENNEGETYTLLLFEQGGELNTLTGKLKKSASESGILLLVIYCAMIIGFVIWLNRKITKPLQMLSEQISSFEIGVETLDYYRGPREFREIFDGFSTMANRLENSEQERRKLEEDKRTMLADITHDLKTPITVIQGYAKALGDGVIPASEEKQYLATIQSKSDDLNELIDKFYQYNKLEHPDYKLSFELVDICNYLRDYVADMYGEWQAAGFAPEVDIPESHILCRIDKMQFKRALDNIVGNSVKHSVEGTILYFSLSAKEKFVVITLADNGIGISPEINDQIFSPFIMGEASRSGGGSGLGLSIAKRIVEMHDGEIRLMAEKFPYKTAFEITLPQI